MTATSLSLLLSASEDKLYYGFDPGDTTGIACFSNEGVLQYSMQLKLDDLIVWVNDQAMPDFEDNVVIIEEFVLFARRARQQAGSSMKASQAIGLLKGWASRYGAKIVMQRANIKPIAMQWAQVSMPSQHSQTHHVDAYLHVYYYLVSQGVIKTRLQLQMEAASGKEE